MRSSRAPVVSSTATGGRYSPEALPRTRARSIFLSLKNTTIVSPVALFVSAVLPSFAADAYALPARPVAMRLSMREPLTNMSTWVPVRRLVSPLLPSRDAA